MFSPDNHHLVVLSEVLHSSSLEPLYMIHYMCSR